MSRRDPAALRPQPSRDGPDFWPTPPCLTRALVRVVLPALPAGPVWEPAAGDGRLAAAVRAAGRTVFASDLYPRATGIARCDFLTDAVPDAARGSIAVTNPPFTKLDPFIGRGLALLDRSDIAAFVLLLRHDHLQSKERVDVLNRATLAVHCNWRPTWIERSKGNPRWSFSWIGWRDGPTQTRFVRDDDRQGMLL